MAITVESFTRGQNINIANDFKSNFDELVRVIDLGN